MIYVILKKSIILTTAIISFIFTFFPESLFKNCIWVSEKYFNKLNLPINLNYQDINLIISHSLLFITILVIIFFILIIFHFLYNRVIISGENYKIVIKYGNIIKEKKCKRVINFDECFTTNLGNSIADINENSICGQYLKKHPNIDMQNLIDKAEVKPAKGKSKYKNKIRFESGIIVPNGDDLLMSFAKLDENGKGRFFSLEEYLKCLNVLWEQLENHCGGENVCVPLLGAGTTSFTGCEGSSISPQKLLNMMIWSYRLSLHKIHPTRTLYIICKRDRNFSIYDIVHH